ncbi:MAG: hypothetical protein LBU38_01820 [Propionibacteriaceae bacterium]|jgi:hypothetical protein|nr:hypothetical protein [Propionibacteriaceae bacterium]
MIWVWVFLGIALAGLVMLVSFAVWLAHKAADIFSELQMLGDRAAEMAELVSKLELAQPAAHENNRE